jgi:hypothetical protein
MSRLQGNDINLKTNDPEDMMLEIMQLLNDTVEPIPEPGKYYTFVYNPKTPNINYDQHPLIACIELQRWGFKAFNFHRISDGIRVSNQKLYMGRTCRPIV